jgi:hypothetical protein
MMVSAWPPMPLIRIHGAFNHPGCVFERKPVSRARALVRVEGHLCRLVSRRGHEFKKFTLLAEEIAHSVRADDAIALLIEFTRRSDR